MDSMKWEKLTEVQGRLEAELIESFLEANGVDVELIQESVGRSAFPVMVDGSGTRPDISSQRRISRRRVNYSKNLLRAQTRRNDFLSLLP